ncbi:serine/threonine protein kinase, CMGC, dual-specificity [Coemansia sp. RSA 988]|nr:serine/threonine protein kinase, CMGC, dual-specificity [Coemansia sp. RSA 988]
MSGGDGGIEDLTTAVETMCEGFDRQCQRQRTLSWVSSALSSAEASTAGGQQENSTESNSIITNRQMAASGRQHVRLTTIDPVTGSIIEPVGTNDQQLFLHEEELAGPNGARATGLAAVDPGYIEKVFIKPNILYTAIPSAPLQPPRTYPANQLSHLEGRASPSISELSVDSSIDHLRGRFGSKHTSGEAGSPESATGGYSARCTKKSGYLSDCAIDNDSSNHSGVGDTDDNSDEPSSDDGAGNYCRDNSTAPHSSMRRSQRAEDVKYSKGRRLVRTNSLRTTQAGSKSGPTADTESGADSEAATNTSSRGTKNTAKTETWARIPAHSSRRTTLGVGGSGTTTLGHSYSDANLFTINRQPGALKKASTDLTGPHTKGTAKRQSAKRASATLEANKGGSSTALTTDQVPSKIPGATGARTSTSSKHLSVADTSERPQSPSTKSNLRPEAKRAQNSIAKASTMSRATASNFLHPHLRRRSKSGVFEGASSTTNNAIGGDDADSTNTQPSAAGGAKSGAATISTAASKGRAGPRRAGITTDRSYMQRAPHAASASGTEEEHSAVLATSAAAGVAGRPRRMTHQATRLTIDPERARIVAVDGAKRGPATATGTGPAGGRRFLQASSSNNELAQSSGNERQTSSSEKDSGDGASVKVGNGGLRQKGSATFTSTHRPLQARLETSAKTATGAESERARPTAATHRAGRPSLGATGTRLPTWRTQQAVRESDERISTGKNTPQRASLTSIGAGGTKLAVRENSAQSVLQEKSGEESKVSSAGSQKVQPQSRPTQAKLTQTGVGRNQGNNNMSSSVSAIGIGSYNSAYQAPRPAPRAGAAASVVGAVAPYQQSTGNAATQPTPIGGQGVRSQVASYQQRFGGGKGASSVVSAATGSTQTAVHAQHPATKAASVVQAGARQRQQTSRQQQQQPSQQQQQQQHNQAMAAAQTAPSRSQSAAHSSSRMSGPISGRTSVSGVPPLTPQEAIARYGQQLSGPERTEILEYPHVYYVGNAKARMASRAYAYDDERGDYIIHARDHLLYRYELVDVLGKGSFGQVLRARDHKTGDIVAIKIIRNRKRFHHQAQTEVKLLECLRRWDPTGAHNILQMTASFYFRNHLCIVMELLDINLYEWLKAHQFTGTPVPLLRHFTVQMLQSLQLMGRHRIIHADLKPENILLATPPPMPPRRAAPAGTGAAPPHPLTNPQLSIDMQRGMYTIKVIDLGSSCFENERVYTYIQSRFYRAPEVILGLPYGPGIDVWSLGCIVVELLTGYPLFPGENEREQLACIVEVLGPPPPYLLEHAPRCADFAEPVPYGVQAAPVGNMLLMPNGACVVGSMVIKPYTSTKNKRRRPGSRPLDQVLARARDPRLVDFVMRTLAWDPAMRMSSEDALRHPWITDMPFQQPRVGMAIPGAHMGVVQPGYVMMPAAPVAQQQQQPHQLPPQAGMATAHGAYMQQTIPQQPTAYGNVAHTRKA